QVRRTRPTTDGLSIVGVALISKDPPELDAEDADFESSSEDHTASEEAPASPRHPTIDPKEPLVNGRYEPRAKLRFNLSIQGRDEQGSPFSENIHTEDVSRHGLCFFISSRELELNSIIQLIGFQGRFSAQAEVRHITPSAGGTAYRIGVRLLGDPQNWIVR